MIRKAETADIPAIAGIYDEIHAAEAQGRLSTGWQKDVYPTRATAEAAVAAGDMFVMETDGRIVASARINQYQGPEYELASWSADAPPERTMLLHTLAVSPACSGKGLGTEFVRFYEKYAREQGCPYLRMDTNARNVRARALYARLGYAESCIVPTVFNGIAGVDLVCLDKILKEDA